MGVQEQFGQLYEGFLPAYPAWLAVVSVVVPFAFCATSALLFAATTPLKVKGDQVMDSARVDEGLRLLLPVMCVAFVVIAAIQTAKALGLMKSAYGSLATLIVFALWMYYSYKKMVSKGSDRFTIRGFAVSLTLLALAMIVINQFFLKKADADWKLGVLWLAWTLIGEITLGYWRKSMRSLDLNRCDPRWIPFDIAASASTVNCGKRICLFSMTSMEAVILMNVICFIAEV